MRRLLLSLTILFATTTHAIPVEDYVATLERVHALISSNQLAQAKAEALLLKDARVEWTGGTFHGDTTLLEAVAHTTTVDRLLLQRLELTVAELRRSGAVAPARADTKLLEAVAREQDVEELAAGGDVATTLPTSTPLLQRVAKSIGEIYEWLSDKIGKLLEWLFDLFPGSKPEKPGATGNMRWIVIAVTIIIVIVIALLAFEVTRRSKRREAAAVATSEPLGSKRDDDPLSRGATEWERYAAQLAAAGRYREAIRAWYHAVLVTCYSAGVLHFRKGRTNWEYVATVAPAIPWRPRLIELTRRFELEWYGHDQSSEDALEDCSELARGILDDIHQRGAA
jgi:hypothetical protein